MALHIKNGGMRALLPWVEWHTGEPLPEVGRVVTIQADGDELEVILNALKGGR